MEFVKLAKILIRSLELLNFLIRLVAQRPSCYSGYPFMLIGGLILSATNRHTETS